jgi:hypothetical protein
VLSRPRGEGGIQEGARDVLGGIDAPSPREDGTKDADDLHGSGFRGP